MTDGPSSCDPCGTCIPPVMSNDFFKQALLVALCDVLATLEVDIAPWTAGTSTLTRTSTTTSGTVAAGAYSVSISNVGSATGTVLGVTILSGETLNFGTVSDEVTRIYKKLPAIAYDGTGTTLHLTVQT